MGRVGWGIARAGTASKSSPSNSFGIASNSSVSDIVRWVILVQQPAQPSRTVTCELRIQYYVMVPRLFREKIRVYFKQDLGRTRIKINRYKYRIHGVKLNGNRP